MDFRTACLLGLLVSVGWTLFLFYAALITTPILAQESVICIRPLYTLFIGLCVIEAL